MILANAGTPLMWFGCCWLLVGNVVIAMLEGWVLSRLTGAPYRRCSDRMVIGNYASMIVGYLLFCTHGDWWPAFLWMHGTLIAVMWLAAFLLSVAIESPFVAWGCGLAWRSAKVWWLSLIANACSYAVILPLALFVSFASLPWQATLVSDARSLGPPKGWIYYVRGPEIRRIRTDGSSDERVVDAPAERDYGVLSVDPTRDGARADLVWFWAGGPNSDKTVRLRKSIGAARQAPLLWGRDGRIIRFYRDSRAQRFVDSRYPQVVTYYWAAVGLIVDLGDRHYNLAMETPFAAPGWSYATVLPREFLVASLGGRVVLVNLRTRQIAILTEGDCPSPLLDLADAPPRTVQMLDPARLFWPRRS